MEILGERPTWSMNGSTLLSVLDTVDAELARLQRYRLQLLARLDDIGHAKEIGAGNTAELVARRYRLDRPAVRRDLRLAAALPKYNAVSAALSQPATQTQDTADAQASADAASAGEATTTADAQASADAASAGEAESTADGSDPTTAAGGGPVLLYPAQAEAIVSALERVPHTVHVDDLRVAEEELVKLAAHLTPGELRQAAKRVRDLLDTDGPEPDEQKAYGRESLTLTPAENGVKFHGYLANENAERLRTLIHAGAKPHKTIDGELDLRPRDKRQADALSDVLSTAAAANDTPGGIPGHGPKANITVTINLDDLRSATADAIGDLTFGDALSAAAVRRLACDAKVIPIVLGSNSQPLDVGTAERFVTGPIRTALNTRDRGCVVCTAPPSQCDAHHLIHWANGGPTALENLVLLCKRHHIDLHAGHWTITITNGVVHVTRPTWADPAPHPHPPAHHPPSDAPDTEPPPPAHPQPDAPAWLTPEETARPNPWGDEHNAVGEQPAPARPHPTAPRPWSGPADTDPPALARPRPDAPAWLTPEETARLNPWGDELNAVGEQPAPARPQPTAPAWLTPDAPPWPTPADTARLNPWGDEVNAAPPPGTSPQQAKVSNFSTRYRDPWADDDSAPPTRSTADKPARPRLTDTTASPGP